MRLFISLGIFLFLHSPVISLERVPLPTVITPHQYDITLKPYLDIEDDAKAFTFDGEISILLHASEDNVDKIVMNAKFIEDIKEINPSNDVSINDIKIENEDVLVLTLNKALVKNQNYTFSLSYRGTLQTDMTGFYRSSYVENGVTRWLATTQFQSDDARKAFPCFDEPFYKSIFKITIDCPFNYTCLSNMPIESSNGDLIKFHPTPLMSSYIIAFIVAPFIPIQITDTNAEKHFGIWGRPGAAEMGDHAFDVGPKLVEEFDKYLGVNYYEMNENIKMDHVAIPDFWPGAMENWGLITYKESYLMHVPSEASIKYRQQTTSVMAHEIAHMWFGNLVTCRYWSDVWLNEAFAAYFQHYITEKVEEFGMKDQFIIAQTHSSLLGDMKISSDENYVASNRKGAVVIRMIEHLIGSEDFAKGLNHYLTTNAYKTVTPSELYASFDASTNTESYDSTIDEIMGSWISQAGYPILSVSVNHTSGEVILEQKNFDKQHTDNAEVFPIPITYACENDEPDFENTKPEFIMKNQTQSLQLPESPGWVIFNIQQTGFYRVMYDNETWDLLTSVLKDSHSKIHEYNRAQLVDDAFNLAREGIMEYSNMLDIIKYLEKETEYTPWTAAYNGISYLRIRFSNIDIISKLFDDFILRTMNTVIKHVGLDVKNDDSYLLRSFRINTMNLACVLEHSDCVKSSINKYNELIKDDKSVHPDLRERVYCNALRHGDEESFNFLWNKYQNENVVSEKVVILGALGCTRKQNKVMEYLLKTIDDESEIRDQDRMNAYNSALNSNIENADTVLEFIINNTATIKSIYGSSRLNTMFINLASRLSNDSLSEFEEYLSSESELTDDDKLNGMNALENSRKELEWTEGITEEITAWLKKNSAQSIIATYSLIIFASLYAILIN